MGRRGWGGGDGEEEMGRRWDVLNRWSWRREGRKWERGGEGDGGCCQSLAIQ